ncbi:hydroxyacylglutathione hydrolase [soil metagenome]
MRIQTVPCLSDNLSYLVIDDATQTCVAIDPGEARPFLETIREQNLRLIAVLATHHHYDHVGGLSQLPSVPVWSSKRDLDRIPGAGESKIREAFIDSKTLTWSELAGLPQDAVLKSVPIELRTMSIPGHTEGQTALIVEDARIANHVPHVFVGDTLFALGCGRCLEGTPEILFESLQKLKQLEPHCLVYFGHEYTEKNALFWLSHRKTADADPRIDALRFDADHVARQLESHMAYVRATRVPKPAPRLDVEIANNPFLQIKSANEFRRWRELRNSF